VDVAELSPGAIQQLSGVILHAECLATATTKTYLSICVGRVCSDDSDKRSVRRKGLTWAVSWNSPRDTQGNTQPK
jgi:hypothetical protein